MSDLGSNTSTADKGRSYRGYSQDERSAERRAKLVNAGIAVFGSQGFHASTVKAVCAEAGLTERYFYESFANSEALLLAAYLHAVAGVHADVIAALAAAPQTPDELTRAALSTYYRAMQSNPPLARLLLIEVLGVSPTIDQAYRRVLRDFGLLISHHQAQVLRHRAVGLDPELLSAALMGAVVQLAHHWVLSGYKKPLAAVINCSHAVFKALAQSPDAAPTAPANRVAIAAKKLPK